jgi:hypothetical protein
MPIRPVILAPRAATKVVAASDAPTDVKARADYVCDGTADDVEIQAAIDALTAGRTRKETVKCIGSFTLATFLDIPSYTTLDLTEAELINNSQNTIAPWDWIQINAKTKVDILHGVFRGNAGSGDLADRPNGAAIKVLVGSSDINIDTPTIYYPRQIGVEAGDGTGSITNLRIYNPTVYGYRCAGVNVGKCNGAIVRDFFIKAAYGVIVEHGPASNIKIGPGTYEHDDTPGTGFGYAYNIVANEGDIVDISFEGLRAKLSGYLTGLYIYAEGAYNIKRINFDDVGCLMGAGSNYGLAIIGGAGATGEISDLFFSHTRALNSPAASGFSVNGTNILIKDVHFTDCKSNLNFAQGFEIVNVDGPVWFVGCEANDNNVQDLAGNSGFYLDALSLGYIIGCRAIDTRTPKKQEYGLRTFAGDTIYAYQNDFDANEVAGILNGGGTLVPWSNLGYVTENSGAATITAGQTSVNVTHGLATTPTRVVLTPTTDTAGRRYWISAKGATTFTITIDSTHTADISFDWQAQVGEG